MANQIEKVNNIAVGDIEKINLLADANIEKLNTLEYVSAATPVEMQTSVRGLGYIGESSSSSNYTTVTIPTGLNNTCFVVVAMHTARSNSPANNAVPRFSQFDFDGTDMTLAASYGAYNTSNVSTRVEFWYIVNPDTGSQDLTYYWSNKSVGYNTGLFGYALFHEVNQTTPLSTFTHVTGTQTRSESNANNTETDGGNSAHSNGGGVINAMVKHFSAGNVYNSGDLDEPGNEPLTILAGEYGNGYTGDSRWDYHGMSTDGNTCGGYWAGFQPFGETQTFTHVPASAGYGDNWVEWRLVSCAINPA